MSVGLNSQKTTAFFTNYKYYCIQFDKLAAVGSRRRKLLCLLIRNCTREQQL